jgi:hypothetical protein
MSARIVVTGLLFDPDTSLSSVLFGPTGLIPGFKRQLTRTQTTLRRNTSKRGPMKSTWRTRANEPSAPTIPPLKREMFSEAPFQKAVAKQQSLSVQGRPYLRHSWHRIDMIAVISFWINLSLALARQEATTSYHVYIFRALSVLRAGRLLVITSGTTTILHSLKRAGPLLITVAYFLIFAAGLFSIIGVQSFRGSFRRECMLRDPYNSSNIIATGQPCGGYIDPITLTRSRYLDQEGMVVDVRGKGYTCPLNQICQVSRESIPLMIRNPP